MKKKIIFYMHSPTSYQIDFFNELKKIYDVFVIYKNKFSINHIFHFKKKKWMFFLKNNYSHTLQKYIELIKPNAIIIGGYKMDFKIKDKSIKKYFWLERVDEDRNKVKKILRKLLISIKIQSATAIFAIGKQAVKFYKDFHTKVFNIPYSIIKQKKINKFKNPKFLFVGQFIKRKGLEKLIDIIKQIDTSKCSFTFVGEGPLKKKITALTNIKKNVYCYTFQNKKNLNKIYSKNNILILPSLYDGWGVVVIEAMSRGMAIISNKNVGAAAEYIRHNFNGRFFKNNIQNSLKLQINFFLENPKKISSFGNRNINLFKINLCNATNLTNKIKKIIN